jgi:flagellar biosynthesis protein FlhF
MNVKTFQAPSMPEVLAKVKSELGTDAIILHTRSFTKGGVLGFMKQTVVEVTASTEVNVRSRKVSPARQAAGRQAGRSAEDSGQYATVGAGASRRETALQEAARTNPVRNAYAANSPRTAAKSGGTMTPSAPSSPANTASPTTRQLATEVLREPGFELRNEMASLRTMVESLLQRTTNFAKDRKDLPEQLSRMYAQLIEQQVSDELAIRVVDDVRAELTPEQIGNTALVRDRLIAKLEMLLPACISNVARPQTGNGCRTICLIGPTGVGKTTTIAKLAAAFKLRQKQKVGLITIDTYRIAAVDQLRTYANIIGVPLKVVVTPSELQAAIREFSDCDTVLIDTAGRAHTDRMKLSELAGFIEAGKPSEVHLVLSSTCTQKAMEAAYEEFAKFRVDQIIFTKLDEAVSFGVLLNVARKASKALSYVTTGQDVPDHIEVGQPRRLARLILGEKL